MRKMVKTSSSMCARTAGLSVAVSFVLFWAGAASAGAPADADERYRSEREACAAISDSESRASCLREAAAARDAARRGQLDDGQGAYEQNAFARCDALPAAERDSCRRRVRGEGETRGSVGSGGIIREYRELTLPSPTPQAQ